MVVCNRKKCNFTICPSLGPELNDNSKRSTAVK